jgi:hypothetical protein
MTPVRGSDRAWPDLGRRDNEEHRPTLHDQARPAGDPTSVGASFAPATTAAVDAPNDADRGADVADKTGVVSAGKDAGAGGGCNRSRRGGAMSARSTVVLIRTVTAHSKSRTWMARLRELRTEARSSPGFRGIAAATCGAALFRASRWEWRKAASLGIVTGIAQGALLRAEHRLQREIRNSGDAAAVALWLGSSTPPLGGWAIEPDFGRLIAIELADLPDVVVECGSGATTLLIAALLQRNGRGRLFTLEHDRAYAERMSQRLRAAGLDNVCEVIWAPLTRQSFGETRVHWYDAAKVVDLPEKVDVVLVDGPPAVAPWARWPALEVLADRLTPGASVLVDDGRRREELRTVFRWKAEHDDLELHWHDTVKGTWHLVKSDSTRSPRRAVLVYRYVRRRLNPRPQGSGRWPVQR